MLRHARIARSCLISVLLIFTLSSCKPVTTIIISPDIPPSPTPLQSTLPAATAAPTWTPIPPQELQDQLSGLDFDAFLEASYQELLNRDPELVLYSGLHKMYGNPPPVLTDNSEAARQSKYELYGKLLEILQTYDEPSLSPEQQISYQVYAWYLDDRIREQAFAYHDYPVVHFLIGEQYQLLDFFRELHPIENQIDAQGYVARLGYVDEKIDGIIEQLTLSRDAGVVAPQFAFQWEIDNLRDLAQGSPLSSPYYAPFKEKLNALSDLSADEKSELLDAALQEVQHTVQPAYAELVHTVEDLMAEAPEDGGVWQYPQGEAYYQYALRHHTTSDLTPEQIHQLGLQELERVQSEMREIFAQLGYPTDDEFPDLFQQLAVDGGYVTGNDVVETYAEFIRDAEDRLDQAFDLRPQAKLEVAVGPGDFYVRGSMDGSRPGVFYASVSGREYLYEMPTLAYHEGVPGHHFQIALAQEMDLPTFRRVESFTAYDEGWALYAERLAYELGWYEDDPYGNLGRLQAEAFRAARLVVDTGIHIKGWSFKEAHQFMVQNTGMDSDFLEFEVSRYMTWPGQALAYKIGMLKILELRQRAMDVLGDDFDLKAFHHLILENGSVPLPVLEQIVEGYLQAAQGS